MHPDTRKLNDAVTAADHEIGELLAREMDQHLPEAESTTWHAHPAWYPDGNRVAGYSKLKHCSPAVLE